MEKQLECTVYELFPIPVGCYEFDRPLSESELAFILKQNKHRNDENFSSDDVYILDNEELIGLNVFINKCLKSYFHELYCIPKTNLDIIITQSWANYTKTDQEHHVHWHPNSFISGVFYIKADPDKDSIRFYRGHRNQYSTYEISSKQYNMYNCDNWNIPVKDGQLLLFPSTLMHGVDKVEHSDSRISIAFNSFFSGKLGGEISKTALFVNTHHQTNKDIQDVEE